MPFRLSYLRAWMRFAARRQRAVSAAAVTAAIAEAVGLRTVLGIHVYTL